MLKLVLLLVIVVINGSTPGLLITVLHLLSCIVWRRGCDLGWRRRWRRRSSAAGMSAQGGTEGGILDTQLVN